jgi:hypothetical protein
MAGEADQTLHTIDEPVVDESKRDFGTESDISVASSSSNMTVVKIEDKIIPDMSDYWKKSTITEADRKAHHSASWLNDDLESSVNAL